MCVFPYLPSLLCLLSHSPSCPSTLRFDALTHYCEESGTCNVPRTKSYAITDGRVMKLGEWVNTQRRQKLLGTLAPERITKLDQLVAEGKFVWSLQWVPSGVPGGTAGGGAGVSGLNSGLGGAESGDAGSVGDGVNSGSGSSSSPEGMITVHQALWNLNYQSLLCYHEVHGHYNVPYHFSQSTINGNPSPLHLGYWLHR